MRRLSWVWQNHAGPPVRRRLTVRWALRSSVMRQTAGPVGPQAAAAAKELGLGGRWERGALSIAWVSTSDCLLGVVVNKAVPPYFH